jgi:DNA-binding CsgD family transcriptional regulator/tetratricopeptide (TPR) repeat protein
VRMSDGPTTGAGRLLERSEQLEALDGHLGAVAAHGRGRLVLIGGEAGIGKSALVRAFTESTRRNRVLRGACDALFTPRPLGPFVDIADEVGGELGAVVAQGAAPGVLVAALGRSLRGKPPDIVALEDLHWADEATLDVLRLLGRRIESLPALVLATYRDDEIDRAHPLRIVLGELPSGSAHRIALAPLSAQAVAELAGSIGVDRDELHRRTAGNPFFVTEVLAAADADIPATVRDAVLARAARLDDGARALLDAVAIVPLRAEVWLLAALAGGELDDLDACVASGMLRAERDAVSFRHEIARVAVEEALSPHRRMTLHRKALVALAAHGARPDPARLAHHAEAADDAEAVLLHAPAAGERAAMLGSHREAAAQFARALRYGADLPRGRRAELLERRSYECYLTNDMAGAIDARRLALEEHSAAGDRLRQGDAHRWLSRLAWFRGESAAAESEARRAVELLQPLAPGRELAMAYSNMAQLRMLASDQPAASAWGERAIELAERLGETEIVVHALNNVGAAELEQGMTGGRAKLERSLELALEADLEEHVARAYTNLGAGSVAVGRYERGDPYLDAGIAYCAEHDLDAWLVYMTGWRSRSELDHGRWDAAAASATVVLERGDIAIPSRITALAVVGSLRARRGDPDPWAALDEALELASSTGEVQRVALVAGARAEARWLAGENEEIAGETDVALALALQHGHRWLTGGLCVWRRRAGIVDEIAPDAAAEPFRLELEGTLEAAAEGWTAIGCPYEAALALAHAGADGAQRRGLAELQRLGAHGAARRVARTMRERGVRDVRRGPRAATRENPAGLTARELEVLALVAEGLRNAEIAGRLFVSERTVGHHVSAILRKLDVGTRSQAGAEAARLGIVER